MERQRLSDQNKLQNREKRDVTGKFTVGCSPGPGRPAGSGTTAFNAAFVSCFNESDIHQLAGKLKRMALAGNTRAMVYLLDRLAGPPWLGLQFHADVTFNPDEHFDQAD